jgi:hypothetical protein
VLGSLWAEQLYSEASTSRAGGVLPQIDFIPKIAKQLAESPEQVVADLQEIRKFGARAPLLGEFTPWMLIMVVQRRILRVCDSP